MKWTPKSNVHHCRQLKYIQAPWKYSKYVKHINGRVFSFLLLRQEVLLFSNLFSFKFWTILKWTQNYLCNTKAMKNVNKLKKTWHELNIIWWRETTELLPTRHYVGTKKKPLLSQRLIVWGTEWCRKMQRMRPPHSVRASVFRRWTLRWCLWALVPFSLCLIVSE